MRVTIRAVTLGLLLWGGSSARGAEGGPPAPCRPRHASAPAAMRALELSVGGAPVALGGVRLVGLHTLPPAQLASLAGLAPDAPPSWSQAVDLVSRLEESGLFAQVTPRLEVSDLADGGAPAVLTLELREHPTLLAVEVTGATELDPGRLLEAMFDITPSRDKVIVLTGHEEDDEHDDGDEDEDEQQSDAGREDDKRQECPLLAAPPELLARVELGKFVPGLVLQGLEGALERARGHLRAQGYLLSTVEASLSAEGKLTLAVDEGRLAKVEVVGLHPELAARVERELALRPGEILLESDVDAALERVETSMPFVERADGHRGEPAPAKLTGEPGPEGSTVYRFERAQRHRRGEAAAVETEGRALRLSFEVKHARWDFDFVELIRHTQVTSFAPGLWGTLRLQDPADRVRGTVDLGLNINTGRRGSERFDGLVGASIGLPRLHLAELGAQYHALVDTTDRWRIARVDSYWQSLVLNRPGATYFRREGATVYATTAPLLGFTAGVEYRWDRYRSLAPAPRVFTLLRRHQGPFENEAIDDGAMASTLLRLEWSSRAPRPETLRSARRDPELSLYAPDLEGDRLYLRTSATLELAGDLLARSDFHFARWQSVTTAYLPTGRHHGFWLRARVAGGDGLPRQKQEALGGWSALRGYDFEELRGDYSLLGSVEYRWEVFSVFADLGSVRAARVWSAPKLGLGAAFHFGDEAHLALAWRTDELSGAVPQVNFFFQRPF